MWVFTFQRGAKKKMLCFYVCTEVVQSCWSLCPHCKQLFKIWCWSWIALYFNLYPCMLHINFLLELSLLSGGTIACFSYGLYAHTFLNTRMSPILKYFPCVVNIKPFLCVCLPLFPLNCVSEIFVPIYVWYFGALSFSVYHNPLASSQLILPTSSLLILLHTLN